MLRSPKCKVFKNIWHIPGGKVEEQESFEEALVRELQEELGIKIKITKPLYTQKNEEVHHMIFLCRIISGYPKIKEPNRCLDIKYYTLNKLPYTPKELEELFLKLSSIL